MDIIYMVRKSKTKQKSIRGKMKKKRTMSRKASRLRNRRNRTNKKTRTSRKASRLRNRTNKKTSRKSSRVRKNRSIHGGAPNPYFDVEPWSRKKQSAEENEAVAEQQRAEEQQRTEEQRQAEEQAAAEEQRQAEEQAAAEQRQAEEQAAAEQRQAGEQAAAEQRQAEEQVAAEQRQAEAETARVAAVETEAARVAAVETEAARVAAVEAAQVAADASAARAAAADAEAALKQCLARDKEIEKVMEDMVMETEATLVAAERAETALGEALEAKEMLVRVAEQRAEVLMQEVKKLKEQMLTTQDNGELMRQMVDNAATDSGESVEDDDFSSILSSDSGSSILSSDSGESDEGFTPKRYRPLNRGVYRETWPEDYEEAVNAYEDALDEIERLKINVPDFLPGKDLETTSKWPIKDMLPRELKLKAAVDTYEGAADKLKRLSDQGGIRYPPPRGLLRSSAFTTYLRQQMN